MRKYFIISLIILIFYIILTFLISFASISKSLATNNPILLNKYLSLDSLKNYYYDDFYNFSITSDRLINKKININNGSIKFEGELTSNYLKKIFSKISSNLAEDFSNPIIILFFYNNSNEISKYLEKYLVNLGKYTFKEYLLEHNTNNNKIINNQSTENQAPKINEKERFIFQIMKRIKSTDYFFLSSPIDFKIQVKHQGIIFVVILRFNGYLWKIHNIRIPYKYLIN